MAVDINNGFINQRPDGVENEFEANKKMQSNPGGLPIGDYMISQPDSNLHNVYLQQAYPENTVWNTGLNTMTETLNKAGGTSLESGDLTMGTPTYFYEGDQDYSDNFLELSGLGAMTNPDEYSTATMGLTKRGIKHQNEYGEVIPHEVGHLYDSIWGMPYNHESTRPPDNYDGLDGLFASTGITEDMIGTPEADAILNKMSAEKIKELNKTYSAEIAKFYARQNDWRNTKDAYSLSRNDKERFMIDPERYKAESNQTLTGYEDRKFPLAAGPNGILPNPNTDSGEWGIEPTEFEKMQQSWFRGAVPNSITQDANGNYVRNDGMHKAQYDRFMNNPNNNKLGKNKSVMADAVATSLSDIGYDSNLFRNTMDWDYKTGTFKYRDIPKNSVRSDLHSYLNKPEERFARLMGSYFSPDSNNRRGSSENLLDLMNTNEKPNWKGPYANRGLEKKYKGPNFSEDAMSKKDVTTSAMAGVLARNRRRGW